MTEHLADGDREIADLLPWYETGQLNPDDTARVAAALGRDPALRRELELVREERQATVAVNEALGAPSRATADRLFARLDALAPRRGFGFAAFGNWLASLQPRTMAFAAIAALAIVAGQFGVMTFHARTTGAVYESASAPQRALEGPTLLVAFQPATTMRAAQALLESERLAIVSGPSGGFFAVRLAGGAPSSTDVDKVVARLQARRDVIRSVLRGQAE